MTSFEDYCKRLRATHNEKFTDAGLAQKFVGFFNGPRIKVRFKYGEVKTGTVSGTTGWQPSFMLMLARNHRGSSWLLSDQDEIIGVKHGRMYRKP